MIHGPDNTDSIIARMTSRLEFFNSLGYQRSSMVLPFHARFVAVSGLWTLFRYRSVHSRCGRAE
jgi:hypothetical protein